MTTVVYGSDKDTQMYSNKLTSSGEYLTNETKTFYPNDNTEHKVYLLVHITVEVLIILKNILFLTYVY